MLLYPNLKEITNHFQVKKAVEENSIYRINYWKKTK